MTDIHKSPNALPWPPIVMIVGALAAIGLGVLLPLRAPEMPWLSALGFAVAAIGLGIDLWAIITMRRARTNVLPHRGADRLVTWGPFRFSRNPIYVANTLLLIGIGLAGGNLWFVILGFVAAAIIDRLAIRREERHLAARFGAAWTAYAATTARWLSWPTKSKL